jgi:hypothetical protein
MWLQTCTSTGSDGWRWTFPGDYNKPSDPRVRTLGKQSKSALKQMLCINYAASSHRLRNLVGWYVLESGG